jgi:DedD protein
MPEADILKRYRVTGALFLLALAAIVGPMLFDGAGLEAPPLEPMPERSGAEPVVAPPEAFTDLEAVAEQAKALRSRADDNLFEAAAVPDREAAAAEAENASPVPAPEPARAPAREQPKLAQPSLEPVSASTAVWAVQVGSFSRRDNAVALRKSLRDEGFEAFLSDVSVRDQVRTRVAVGPYLSEGDADSARARIAQQFELDARLVAMVI